MNNVSMAVIYLHLVSLNMVLLSGSNWVSVFVHSQFGRKMLKLLWNFNLIIIL